MSTHPIHLRKHDLAIRLQKIASHPKPKASLEQYTTPADVAAEILFTASYVHGDIRGKDVLDFGTGTGRLAIGAALLGAEYVVGVDVDAASLKVASAARTSIPAEIDFVLGEIDTIAGKVDTVVMNPPFGTKKLHADRHFLECALNVANVIYSIHKSSTRGFLEGWLHKRGYICEQIIATKIDIPHQFTFHKKPYRPVEVDAIRITK